MRARVLAVVLSAALPLATAAPASAAPLATQRTWHSDQLRMSPSVISAGRGGSGVLVAVLDSWVDHTHKDFEGRASAGADCTSGTCRQGQGTDRCEHGTHVAGTVASTSYGVAPRARVLPVRVLSWDPETSSCTGRPSHVAAGIRYALAQGAHVINLSLGPDTPGLTSSSALPEAVHEAARAGAVVVASAGNADLPVAEAYDGSALVVAATGPDGRIASYSQHGEGVDLAAPGGDPARASACRQSDCITSLFPSGRYAVAAGTSMAAPAVAGLAALLLGQSPRRGRQDVFSRLRGTARPLAGAGAGLVDATAALGVRAAAKPVRPSKASARPRATPAGGVRAAAVQPPPARPAPRAAAAAPVRPLPPAATAPPPPTRQVPSAAPPPAPVVVAAPASTEGPAAPTWPVPVAAALVALAASGVAAAARLAGRRS